MQWFFQKMLDSIFPPTERKVAAHKIHAETLRSHVRLRTRSLPGGASCITFFPYQYTDIRTCIQALKYDRARDSAHTIVSAMHESLFLYLVDECHFLTQPTALVPIPLSQKRMRKRGHNQSYILARTIQNMYGNTVFSICDALIRTERPSQTDVPEAYRHQNITGTFSLSSKCCPYR